MADARGRRGSRRRARIVAAVVVGVLAAGGGAAWAMTSSSGPTYRTATATVASITQSLNSVGTVQAVDKAVVSFPVAGRVASVSAVVGHPVTVGDVLATLDTTSLDQAVNQANQTVADDQRKLADDQTGQLSSASSATGAGSSTGVATDSAGQAPLAPSPAPTKSSGPSGPAAGSAAPANPASASPVGAVTAAQQRLTRDQRALDGFLTDAALTDLLDLIGPSGACAMTPATATTFAATTDASGVITVTTPQPAAVSAGAATVGAGQQGTGGDTYVITGAPNTAYTVSVTPSTGSIDAATCTGAIQKLVAAIDPSPSDNAWEAAQAVNSDELALAGAISKLEKSSASTGTSRPSSGSGTSSSQRTGSSSTSSASSTGKSGSATSATTATPEQLAADQAAIDAAQAQLDVANQNRDQATIRAPISGTVADVALTAGAAAGSNAVTIIGAGAHEVSTTVSLAEVDLVKVGDSARVTVDGIAAPISGRVTSVGVLNSTTGSTTTFPVTVLLDSTSARLFDGAGAAVSIVVGTVTNALSVPSSAVHGVGALHTVDVLRAGKLTTTVVGIGAVGIDRTQITSGLSAGQRVVLAQLNAPLPTTGTTGRGLGRAGLGGGVLGGTGLTGTGPTGRTRVGG